MAENRGQFFMGARHAGRLFCSVFCLLISVFSPQFSASCHAASADQQQALDSLRQRIAAMQEELEKTSESKSEAADALRDSERAISDSNRQLAELDRRQQAADTKLSALEVQERQLSGNLEAQWALLGRLLYRQYLDGRQEHLKLLLNNRNPSQAARDWQYYRYIAYDRAAWLAALRENLSALRSVSAATRAQRAELVRLREAQSGQKKILEKEKQVRQQVLSRISLQWRQQRREIGRLRRNENRLAQLVEKLAEMLNQRESGHVFRNDSLPDNRFDGSPFDQLKGKLVLPVKGVVTNRFDTPRPGSTVRWKGLFLKTSAGQAVKAVAAGRVVFADWLRGFGNLLIVDHGKGYMSLYANNETLYKQVGDSLHGGDTIAAAGNTGGNEDYGLYFELRYESKPLDPVKWLAAK